VCIFRHPREKRRIENGYDPVMSLLATRMKALHPHLERLYLRWNRPEYVSPDPLQFLREYPDPSDREIVGLVASSLAFGNVKQIIRSIELVLAQMPQPSRWLSAASPRTIRSSFQGFRHRYVTGHELATMLIGAKRIREKHGSLGACLGHYVNADDVDVCNALGKFVVTLNGAGTKNYLVPEPLRGSACKRLHLYLRWMVRADAVDPGGWNLVSPRLLLMPVDTHIHRIATQLGITERRAADIRTAREITAAFRLIAPHDPVRYDFALTRLGIRADTLDETFLVECSSPFQP